MVATTSGVSVEERKAILEKEVQKWVKKGFQVTSRTETIAQLLKKKKFSLLWFFLLLGLFYIPFYIAKKDQSA